MVSEVKKGERAFLTSAGPRVRISGTLAHPAQELVDLLQGQRVVQRLQRVDRGHHGAAFEACRGGETRRPQAHQLSVSWSGRSAVTDINVHPLQTRTPTTHCTSTSCPRLSTSLKSRRELSTATSFHVHTGKLQKPCWTPTRGDTTPTKSAHVKHVAVFAKAKQDIFFFNLKKIDETQIVDLSHTSAPTTRRAKLSDCSSGPTHVSSQPDNVHHQSLHLLKPPHKTGPCFVSARVPSVQQTSRKSHAGLDQGGN